MGAETRLALPSWDGTPAGASNVLRDIRRWRSSASMLELLGASGGFPSDASDFHRLDDFASHHWDFRAGFERDHSNHVELSGIVIDRVGANSAALGLADREEPSREHYDVAILTGGMVRAGVVKPRFTSELMASGIRIDRVVFLGAHRPFSERESALARALGIDGNDEVDGMLEGLRREFRPAGDPFVERSVGAAGPASWGRWVWPGGSPRLEVVAAASADPEHRRANTADTFRFWADRFAEDARSVLVVTTPVYVPYQAAVAVETLGVETGMCVETVGVSARAQDLGPHTQPFTARHHLQELRSAIRAMGALETVLVSRVQEPRPQSPGDERHREVRHDRGHDEVRQEDPPDE